MQSKIWHCNDQTVCIIQLADNHYDLVVHGPQPVGSGNRIESFNVNFEQGIAIGEEFARNLSNAMELGFRLSDRWFRHPDGRNVHVSNALDGRSQEDFKNLLRMGEF